MANTTYSVSIKETSKELTKREAIMMKDVTNAIKLEAVTHGETFTVKPVAYAILDVHNTKANPSDYPNYIILDEDGTKYVTGSKAFWNTFMNIWSEMNGEDDFVIEIYGMDSKNYNGKKFITCSLA